MTNRMILGSEVVIPQLMFATVRWGIVRVISSTSFKIK